MGAKHTEHRDRVARQLHGNEHGRNGVGDDQNHILCHLGIGDALHAAEYRVGKHDGSSDPDTGGVAHFQEAGERHASTGHLADYIGNGDEDEADHSYQASATAVETVTDEVRYGELAELAQVRRQQHRQQHIATSPTHQVDGSSITAGGDQTCHGDEGSCRHPVCRRGHTVGYRVNTTTSDIEFFSRTGAGPDRDPDIKQERRAHEQHVDPILAHCGYSSTPNSLSSLFSRHA